MFKSLIMALLMPLVISCVGGPPGNYQITEYGLPVWCYSATDCEEITLAGQREIIQAILAANK